MSLRKQLKQAWDALAYANAGECLPYDAKCRILGVEVTPEEGAPTTAAASDGATGPWLAGLGSVGRVTVRTA